MSTQATGARAPAPYSELQQEHEHLRGAFRRRSLRGRLREGGAVLRDASIIIGQTILVAIWIVLTRSASAFAGTRTLHPAEPRLLDAGGLRCAAYPQTRQADRDKAHEEAAAKHRDELAGNQARLLEENTALTQQIARLSQEIDSLTREIHARVST